MNRAIAWEIRSAADHLLLAPSGHIVTAGGAAFGSELGIAVVTLWPETGSEVWLYEACCGFSISDMTITPSADVVISNRGSNGFDVVRIDGDTGTETWRYEFGSDSGMTAVRSDAAEDLVAVGQRGTADADFVVAKISGTSGSEIWRYMTQGTSASSGNVARDVAIDSAGDVIALGTIVNASTGHDLAVIKLAGSTGTLMWRFVVDGGLQRRENAGRVAVDRDDDIYVTGALETPAGWVTVLKLSGVSGEEVWREAPWPSDTFRSSGPTVFDGAETAIIVGGSGRLTEASDPVALTAIDTDTGSTLWAATAPGGSASITTLALASDGDVVAGLLAGSEVGFAAYSSLEGSMLWKRTIGVFPVLQASLKAVALGSDGSVFGAGLGAFGFREGVRGSSVAMHEDAEGGLSLAVTAKDPLLFAPTPGGANDPSLLGATVQIDNPSTGETSSIELAANGWVSRVGKQSGRRKWKFSAPGSACPRATLNNARRLSIKCKAPLGFSLDEPAQGRIVVSLNFALGHRHCLDFSGPAVIDDRPGRFQAKDAARGACVD